MVDQNPHLRAELAKRLACTETDLKKLLVIVGSAKCGTSALTGWLDGQPGFREGRRKEGRFFADVENRHWTGPGTDGFGTDKLDTREKFLANFPGLQPDEWAIDASTDYVWWPGTDARLENFAQAEGLDLRLISVVRDPVDRAVSEYNHTIARGMETLSFAEALDEEHRRMSEGWHPLYYHMRRSTISADLERWRERFGERFMTLDYASLFDPSTLAERLSNGLGLDIASEDALPRRNEDRMPRSKLVERTAGLHALRHVARGLLPGPVRKKVWNALHVPTRKLETVSEDERALFRHRMADEIERCLNDPAIPTSNWKSAITE